jgi:predicted transposase YdaD
MREFIRMRNKGLRDFNSAIYHAEARGRAEGEARGEARGRAEGEARGKVEGEAQGKLEKAQEMALKLISKGKQP